MIAATVLLIGLTAVLPGLYMEGQRERERELIFRGIQYARAIAMFHQKFQRYPTKIEDLIKPTNGWRFLRKEYSDPMTRGGKWRYIHANAMGVLIDSKSKPMGGLVQPGSGQGTEGFGMSGSSSIGGGAFGQQSMSGSGFGQQGMGASGPGQSTGGFSLDSNSGGNSSGTQQNSAFFGDNSSQGGGMFIVGVASTSHKPSFRTWNKKTHYDEWEFIGVDLGALGIVTSIPGLPQGMGTQQNQPPLPGGAPGISAPPSQANPATPGQN